jgi:hypothetical protein
MSEGIQKSLLHCILRVFAIVREVFGNSDEFAIITACEFLEGRHIAVLSGVDKLKVIAGFFHRSGLC